jgi:hypothetical protein
MPVFRDQAWGRSLTVSGNAQISEAADPFGESGCGVFDGSGDYLTVASSADFNLGTGNFTADAWVFIAGNSPPDNNNARQAYVLRAANDSFHLLEIVGSATTTGVGLGLWNGSVWHGATVSISQGAWHHLAQCRSNGVVYHFLDGVLLASGPFAYALGGNTGVDIGGSNVAGWNRTLNGRLKYVRLTVGVARWTGNFTPPASTPVGRDDPYWANVALLLPMDFVDVAPVFTALPDPWILQPTPPGTYTIQPKRLAARAVSLGDQWWGGLGRIAGTVQIKGSPDRPVARQVRLFDVRTGILVRETWSDPVTGAYAFTGLDPARDYLALAHDHTRQYNAVVADRLTAEPMP